MNIGIFGGTFNPIHNGHKNCLLEIMKAIDFQKVIILPDRIPPHKQAENLASGTDRLNMCRIALQGIDKLEFSDWELDNEGKSYSVITLRHFKEMYPEDKLYFFMGSDMLLSFHEWYRYEEILSLAALVCVSREEDVTRKHLEEYAEKLKNKGGEVIIVPAKPLEISSSEIRSMLKKNEDCTCYLDKNVVKYIREKKLYN
ncbi:MAG: nicotinate (nicotinamide) nucleotide adenylyltransferase [Oscillospiraceae bacterium]